jgi:hypothetical protein
MQTGPRHHIGFRPEDIADTIPNNDQLDQAEPRVVRIEEEIDIAVRSGFLPGDRAELVQPSHPRSMKLGFVRAKPRDHRSRSMKVSGHGFHPYYVPSPD